MHLDEIRALPKVLLHDHLDGGIRPQTMIDLASQIGYDGLPTDDAAQLQDLLVASATSGSLAGYLKTFTHAVAVMQSYDAIARIAHECAEDLAVDGVVYAEVRFAPELLTRAGLSMADVVEAALEGLDNDHEIDVNLLLCAMRQSDRADEVADLVAAYRHDGVVGMDIAGPEQGFPASRFASTFTRLRSAMCNYTVHAGEAGGVDSIADALISCMPHRIGHGVAIIDDIVVSQHEVSLGPVAQYVLDRQIPLEICPTSNVQTGVADSIESHPITVLNDLGFAVTVNTDNRLMSGTTLSEQMYRLVHEAGWDAEDLYDATVIAAESSFLSYDERLDLLDNEIKPGWEL